MRILSNTIIAFVILFAFSCKKNSDDSDVNTAQDKLVGKWTLVSAQIKETKDDDVETSNVTFDPGSFIDFELPNVLSANVNGQTSQTTWRLADNKVTIVPNGSLSLPEDVHIYEITTISGSDLVLTGHDVDNNDTRNETHDVIIQLHR